MIKIDITAQVLELKKEAKRKEMESLSQKTLPDWLQKPFDEYFAEYSTETNDNNNVVNADFGEAVFFIPKSLAAASINIEQQAWYDRGTVSFKDANGAMLNLVFGKLFLRHLLLSRKTVTCALRPLYNS